MRSYSSEKKPCTYSGLYREVKKRIVFSRKALHKDYFLELKKVVQQLFTHNDIWQEYDLFRNELYSYIQAGKSEKRSPWQFLRWLRKTQETLLRQEGFCEENERRESLEILLALSMRGECRMLENCKEVSSVCLDDGCTSEKSVVEKRKALLQHMPSLSPHSIWHILCHPLYLLGSLQCRSVFHRLFGFFSPFDPKGRLENSAGILYREEKNIDDGRCLIDWNIGPTPTIGWKISPEAKALQNVIQYTANNSFSSERVEKICHTFLPYSGWVYINLQNRRDNNELQRVQEIEQMANNMSCMFVSSLSVDSPHYRVEYNIEKISLRDIANQLKAFFSSSDIFSSSSQSWYFFSIFEKAAQNSWKQVLSSIVEEAYEVILAQNIPPEASRKLHKAFQELVVYGVARAWHGWAFRKTYAYTQKKPLYLISTMSCREGVDRGGALNGGMLGFLLAKTDEEIWKHAMPIIWGRPILFRERLNESQRTEGFFAVVSFCARTDIQDFLHKSLKLGYQSAI